MFQREVAERIVADERDRAELRPPRRARRLAHASAHPLRRAALRLRAAAEGDVERRPADARGPSPCPAASRALEAVTRAAFGQRRKMLRQSLKSIAPEPGALIAAAGLAETARAEEVPVAGFVALANAYMAMRG